MDTLDLDLIATALPIKSAHLSSELAYAKPMSDQYEIQAHMDAGGRVRPAPDNTEISRTDFLELLAQLERLNEQDGDMTEIVFGRTDHGGIPSIWVKLRSTY